MTVSREAQQENQVRLALNLLDLTKRCFGSFEERKYVLKKGKKFFTKGTLI
jgi:hypothetical protein